MSYFKISKSRKSIHWVRVNRNACTFRSHVTEWWPGWEGSNFFTGLWHLRMVRLWWNNKQLPSYQSFLSTLPAVAVATFITGAPESRDCSVLRNLSGREDWIQGRPTQRHFSLLCTLAPSRCLQLTIISQRWGASAGRSVVENKDTHIRALHAQQMALEKVPSLGNLWVFCLFPTEWIMFGVHISQSFYNNKMR